MLKPRTFLNLATCGIVYALVAGAPLSAQTIGQGGSTPGSGSGWGTPGGKLGAVDDDPAGRVEWWRQRIGGELSPEFMARFMAEAEKQRLLYPDQFRPEGSAPTLLPEGTPLPLAVSATTWTNLGPTKSTKMQNGGFNPAGTNSGRLRTILPDPTNANILYVLTSGGGLWKTTNLLDSPPTWRCLSDRVGSDMGGAAAFGPPVSGVYSTLYMGLGDAFDKGVGGFVVKSTDSGSTWSSAIQLTGTDSGAVVRTATKVLDLKVDDTGTGVVLVGTNAGLFRSTNSGASYSLVDNAAFNGKYVWSIVRTGVNTWIASTEDFAAGTLGAIMRSTDNGATWAALATPLTGVGRMTLGSANPGNPIVYCFAANTGDSAQLDLYRSTNSGLTWTATNTNSSTSPATTNGDQGNNDYMHTQAFYNHMLLVDPTDPTSNTLYIGGNLSSAKNTNGGSTGGSAALKWKVLTNWLPGSAAGTAGLPYVHADFHCGAINKVGATTYTFFGSDGGLFMSTDGGTTWTSSKNEGIVSHLVYAMASGPLNNCDANSVLMGLQDNGSHNRVGATSVFDQTKGGDGFGVAWSQSTNAASMASYVYNAIQRCTTNPPNDISKWANFVGGLGSTGGADNGASYYFVTPIITAPFGADATGSVFYTYGNTGGGTNSKKIFRTTGGGNWTALGTLPTPPALGTKLGVRAVSHGVGAHPTDGNRLAAVCNTGYVITTTNAGGVWTPRDLIALVPAASGRTWQGFNSNVAWVDNNVLFAASESTAPNSIHVARSTDGGATWAGRETGLPDLPVTKILADPGDATGNTLYAATWLGVYRTTDQGANWSLFGSGLPQALVSDLYIHPTSSFLRAGIYGRGIWQVGPTPIYTAPAFSSSPASGSFTPGTPFTLTGAVSNTYPAVTYQWRRNGFPLANGGTENISGATTSSLTVTNPLCGSAGIYTLVATNCAGSGVSGTATMTSTLAPPVITSQPADVRYANGNTFSLSVAATGTGLTYRWRRAGVNLTNAAPYSGVTTSTITFTAMPTANAGSFDCVVTGAGGCAVTSNAAQVLTANSPGNIVTNPVDQTVTAPGAATFTVVGGGGRVGGGASITLTFQWKKDGVNLTNGSGGYSWTNPTIALNTSATATSVLTINPTTDVMNGALYSCNVSNAAGNATSNNAKLTVLRRYTPATAVSLTPSPSLPAPHGTPVVFTAVGSGSVLQGTATPSPANAYQYQFWLYIDDALGWTMVQDYSTTNTYTLPTTMQAGSYGIGVDCRTSPTVFWDVYNAIDFFDLTLMGGPPPTTRPKARPAFNGGTATLNIR